MTIAIPDHIRALIFDCDGTLADTVPIHLEAWKETFEQYGYSYPEKLLLDTMGAPTEDILEQYNRMTGSNIDVSGFTREKEKKTFQKLTHARPIPAVVEIARAYHNVLPMAVASGGKRRNVDLIIKAIGLEGCFNVILTADNGYKPKPEPDIFLQAAGKLGVLPGHCLVLEDGEFGIQAARKAGMRVVDIRDYL